MANKYALKALDCTLKDILDNDALFGGKVMVMGGDFCHVLPVMPKGSKAQMVAACIVKLHLWAYTRVIHLHQNMRSLQDHEFAQYLMHIGDRVEATK